MTKTNSLLGPKAPAAPKAPDSKGIDDRPKRTALPAGRQSEPDLSTAFSIGTNYTTVTPAYIRTVIPVIRWLMMNNPDVGQAIHNIVTLGNTGHKIFFDRKKTADQVDQMRNHLINKRKEWSSGQSGIDGLVNRLISQILIGGALSAEAVPSNNLNGIESVILINPEEIEFKLNVRKTKYAPYQRVKNLVDPKKKTNTQDIALIALNTNTYKYFALNGDSELPYGFPPYMSVLPRVTTQGHMDKNINFIVDEWGLLGFLEALIAKPQQSSETNEEFDQKLDNLLGTAKSRILGGVKDGVVVGFEGDAAFKFNSASKSYAEAVKLYDNNELMMASALKQDASMWGRAYATSETQITVVFIKMLSELRNIHGLLKSFLEFLYSLELLLAGFTFDSIEVRFNKSTIQDDLKSQQADEIKIRNVQAKMILGLINQNQAADELGYEVPAFPEPMVAWDVLAGQKDPDALPAAGGDSGTPGAKAAKKTDAKKKKTASAKKTRGDKKPVSK